MALRLFIKISAIAVGALSAVFGYFFIDNARNAGRAHLCIAPQRRNLKTCETSEFEDLAKPPKRRRLR